MRKIWKRKTDLVTQFTQKQPPIHNGTKNRLNTLLHRLLGGIFRGINEILRKNQNEMRL